MKFSWKTLIVYVLIFAVVIFLINTVIGGSKEDKKTYNEIISLFEDNKVKSCVIDSNNDMVLKTTDDQTINYRVRSVELFEKRIEKYVFGDEKNSNLEVYNYEMPNSSFDWLSILPYIIPVVIFIIFWIVFIRQASGGMNRPTSFARSRAKQIDADKKKVTFADVAGADEEKEELREVVEFLKNPKKYVELGARIPRGMLLVGPPGTGKTLLAKAVAGEAGVPFYSISGSDFVEMYVGVGASRVRDLFENAKKNPASIIFIDEIDAVGRHRGAGLGGGNDEREQTLNQLLVEMDGFGTNQGVIVMAATNRPDILDPALLRPGRFDRQITVNYPDVKGRKDILNVHAKGKPFESNVDFEKIAKTTIGFTGADLANLLNEAALRAAQKNKRLIGMNDIEEAMMKIIVGTPKKSAVILEKDRKITAYHEAGHAIVSKILMPDNPVYQISVIPSGRALGYTMNMPKNDSSHYSKSEMLAELSMLLGGRAAEHIIFTDITSGASNDIQRATDIARNMVTKYGMSELGPVVFGSNDDNVFIGRDFASIKNYSEKMAGEIDDAISKFISDAYAKSQEILNTNIEKLHFIAAFLISHETMSAEQFEKVMCSDNVTVEELEKISEDKKKQSDDENERLRRKDNEKDESVFEKTDSEPKSEEKSAETVENKE